MSGAGVPRVTPLRPGDARECGAYRLVGRLGEGGMGTVYLAESGDGRTVAVKVIRAELAHDAEFRRRFRSEVARARQVPPFCTAEVLDADTEYDPPYLVVEYVDGPSLSAVIAERGPLSRSNQHGLAVGVAVALAAIHGAGVIHRDLKPSNVLLAPGSPKVIDFGIARAVEGTDVTTRTNQMVGTVAYMAPERFDSPSAQPLTPGADIFAWGAVVAYAATGRTPFSAETPAALAYRIMTQPPDLDGIDGPLRDLVAQALRKDPAERPTARGLVEALLAGGSSAGSRSTAFAAQPEVLAAAGLLPTEAAAPAEPLMAVAASRSPSPTPAPPDAPTATSTTQRPGDGAPRQRAADPVEPVGQPAERRRPAEPVWPPAERRRPAIRRRLAVAAAFLAVMLVGGIGGAVAAGALPLPFSAHPDGGATSPAAASAPPTADPSAWVLPDPELVVRDDLAGPDYWINSTYEEYGAACTLAGELAVTLAVREAGLYKCQGVRDALTDFSVAVDVMLKNPNSCAGLWFRFTGVEGYAVRVCQNRLEALIHDGAELTTLQSRTLQPAIPLHTPTRIAVKAVGATLTFYRGEAQVFTVTDARYGTGRVTMGVFAIERTDPPFAVSFRNIELWRGPHVG